MKNLDTRTAGAPETQGAEYFPPQFVADAQNPQPKEEREVFRRARALVRALYDALRKRYSHPSAPDTLKSLNVLCVRLVFCLYAQDAGIFGPGGMFHDYLRRRRFNSRQALIDLFRLLDTRPEDRPPSLDGGLTAFPYVNSGLFAGEQEAIPRLDEGIVDLLLRSSGGDFDWSRISPAIFGAVFESTVNPETRRSEGMHYTSVENIHKVIDPLFLDELRGELDRARQSGDRANQVAQLGDLRKRISALKFLDPACGSGNFLTETYLSLRRLENEILSLLYDGGTIPDADDSVHVSVSQFYGIEIDGFAAAVARTALWIAENQTRRETGKAAHIPLNFLPPQSRANIVKGNALRLDWAEVAPGERLDYIIGNPPFVGARMMDAGQKDDMRQVFPGWKHAGNLDYVSCWYKKAADLMAGTAVRAAFVSTSSVTQGEAAADLWKPLFDSGFHIDFARRTFRWDSGAAGGARVHCVIIGFSAAPATGPKVIFSAGRPHIAQNINGYLLDAGNIFVERRSKPLCGVPEIGIGNKPVDGGAYLFTREERDAFIQKEPASEKWFRAWYGSREFIHRRPRYCLWLGDCPPSELRGMPECRKRVQAVRDFRLASKSAETVRLAGKPTRFHVENMPDGHYILLPKVSSEHRRYIPMGFMTPDTFCSDLVFLVPNATLYHFGVLTSGVHMAWTRVVCGRLETRYRYSKDIVYNNFPWPSPTNAGKEAVERTAQAILDARALYPEASLAELYDDGAMPAQLREAHRRNDLAVMRAYGFPEDMPESACAAELMRMYQALVER